jgi:hypothetical protein
MRDEPKDRSPSDRARLDVEQSWERRWLLQELGVRDEELHQALRVAGLIVSPVSQQRGHP